MRHEDKKRAPRGATSEIRGFTIVELLVAMVIVGLVMGAIYSVFISSNRSYHTQDRVADAQQGLRLGLDFMVRDIRMAGLNPRGGDSFGIEEATATRIRFTADTDWSTWDSDDGSPDTSTERVTYEFLNTDPDPNNWILRRGFGD
jgi:type IV pilus assembly protein PilW